MQSSLASSLANDGDDDIDALTANVGPRFEMIASVTLCLDDCSNGRLIVFHNVMHTTVLNYFLP